MTTTGSNTDSAREAARKTDGKFGAQEHARPEKGLEQTWTFIGHWENDEIVVGAVVEGEVQDVRVDDGEHEQGLFASHASGATQEEALANLRREYETEYQSEPEETLPDGTTTIDPSDAAWPAALNDMENPPERLYLRGVGDLTELLAKPTVAITGSRNCTMFGGQTAGDFGKDLAENGCTIVTSGGYGIASAASRAAVLADQPSIIVSSSGIDNDYPQGHQALFNKVAENGVIVSENPPGAVTSKTASRRRSEIMAALAPKVVVVEAAHLSGSLEGADKAISLGRKVYAVPGPVNSGHSNGTNQMIADGKAEILLSADQLR